MTCDLRVGTYLEKTPAAKLLDFYVQHFDSSPANFVLAVKASRFITHNKKLKDMENVIDNLLPRAAHLGPKLGPVLLQLPSHWRVNPQRLENLLQILPRDVRYAFEFRELSWMNPQVDSILNKFNAAFCIYELAGYHSPLNITADFAYIHIHGSESSKYQGSYTEERLRAWARQIETLGGETRSCLCLF